MASPEQEIAEELAHHQAMLQALRQRRRERERQAIQQGGDLPMAELQQLAEQIAEREREIARLATIQAQGALTLGEVEFRALLAEILDASDGGIRFVETTRLERERLRMGIAPARADEIAGEVRQKLCEETFFRINPALVATFAQAFEQEYAHLKQQMLQDTKDDLFQRQNHTIHLIKAHLDNLRVQEQQKAFHGHVVPPVVILSISEAKNNIIEQLAILGLHVPTPQPDSSYIEFDQAYRAAMQRVQQDQQDFQLQAHPTDIDSSAIIRQLAARFQGDIALLAKCIRLDPRATIVLLQTIIPNDNSFQIEPFIQAVSACIAPGKGDQDRFASFFSSLRLSIAQHNRAKVPR